MVHTEVPLGILPAGTANVLAVETGIGTRMLRAAGELERWIPRSVAAGLLENAHTQRHFLLMAGAGLDALIVYNIDAQMKRALGKVAYWIAGFGQVGRKLPEFDVVADGQQVRCSFALASRVRNYGGDLTIARNASLFNDEFELVLFKGAHSLPYLKYFVGALTGRLAHMRGVSILRPTTIELESASGPGIYIQIDGEYAGRLPARLSIVRSAVNLLLPEAFCRGNG
jgi:diacylglycerol kinase family enzyme